MTCEQRRGALGVGRASRPTLVCVRQSFCGVRGYGTPCFWQYLCSLWDRSPSVKVTVQWTFRRVRVRPHRYGGDVSESIRTGENPDPP